MTIVLIEWGTYPFKSHQSTQSCLSGSQTGNNHFDQPSKASSSVLSIRKRSSKHQHFRFQPVWMLLQFILITLFFSTSPIHAGKDEKRICYICKGASCNETKLEAINCHSASCMKKIHEDGSVEKVSSGSTNKHLAFRDVWRTRTVEMCWGENMICATRSTRLPNVIAMNHGVTHLSGLVFKRSPLSLLFWLLWR